MLMITKLALFCPQIVVIEDPLIVSDILGQHLPPFLGKENTHNQPPERLPDAGLCFEVWVEIMATVPH